MSLARSAGMSIPPVRSGVFVNLLQGDDICVGLSEDVGDALKIYLTVQSLGVVNVVGHHAQNHWRDIR